MCKLRPDVPTFICQTYHGVLKMIVMGRDETPSNPHAKTGSTFACFFADLHVCMTRVMTFKAMVCFEFWVICASSRVICFVVCSHLFVNPTPRVQQTNDGDDRWWLHACEGTTTTLTGLARRRRELRLFLHGWHSYSPSMCGVVDNIICVKCNENVRCICIRHVNVRVPLQM